jgi:hypothetical protein
MHTAGLILVVLGVAAPLAVALHGAIDTARENRRHGGPPMEDAFGPSALMIDLYLLVCLGLVFAVPGVVLLILG